MDSFNTSANQTTPPTGVTATDLSNLDAGHLEEHSVLKKTEASSQAPVRISIIMPTNAYFLSGVRDFTKTIVQNITGFSEQWAFRFQAVVDELVNNGIEFGSAQGKDIKVTFVSERSKSIEIYVEDTGTGPNKKTANQMMKIIEDRKKLDPSQITTLRGRGLAQIVSSWTDLLEYTDNEKGGLTAHIVKYIDKGEENV